MNQFNDLAKDLLTIEAVQIKTDPSDYFTWTSGIKSPIYCDNRVTISYPHVRRKITNSFVQIIEELQVKPDVIAGCATAGIPHAAWLADALQLPLIYIRSKPKKHGTGSQIEGKIRKNQKVIVIEDLISTGGSSIEAANVLRQNGNEVLQILAIFTYGLQRAQINFTKEDFSFTTLLSFDQLLNTLVDGNEITPLEKEQLLQWRNQLA